MPEPKNSNHGGARKGAGRPPGSKSKSPDLSPAGASYLKQQVIHNEKRIVDAMIAKAVEEGNVAALGKLLDHGWGKPGTAEVDERPTQIVLKTNCPRPASEPSPVPTLTAVDLPSPVLPGADEEEAPLDQE